MSRPLQLLALMCLSVSLTACASGKYTPSIGHYKVGKPYKIKGKTYHPKESYTHTEVGLASWYGPGFHGKQTANGERFDENALTAAHPTLQMPSFVRVTNLENGKTVVLRVNDRGPFSGSRIIDVSKAGAEALGFRLKGLAKVKVQVLAEESMTIGNAAKKRVDTTGSEIALNRTGRLDARFAAYAPGYQNPAPVPAQHPDLMAAPVMVADAAPASYIPASYEPAAYETMAQMQPAGYNIAGYDAYAPAAQNPAGTAVQAAYAPPQPAPITLQISTPIIEGAQYAGAAAAQAVTQAPTAVSPAVNYVPTTYTSPPPPAPAPVAAAVPVSGGHYVQVGNFLSRGSANMLRDEMAQHGSASIVPARPNDTRYFRVQIGPLQNRQNAQFLVDTLQSQGRQALVVSQ